MLGERLSTAATRLPDGDGVAELLPLVARERTRARHQLLAVLRSERYLALLDRLVAAAAAPPLTPVAETPARRLLPRLVRSPWRRLVVEARRLDASSPLEDLHRLRVRAKRARYAAEAAVPVVGRRAAVLARAATSLQDVLGTLHDATVAEEWLRRRGPRSEVPFVAGELCALERVAAEEARQNWLRVFPPRRGAKVAAWH